eukprot:2049704-Rhodomonas_salina.2
MPIKKNRADEERKRAERKAEIEVAFPETNQCRRALYTHFANTTGSQAIMARHAGKDKKVDMDELREILTEVHGGTPPLPKDLL